jgi:hypothetical protein
MHTVGPILFAYYMEFYIDRPVKKTGPYGQAFDSRIKPEAEEEALLVLNSMS